MIPESQIETRILFCAFAEVPGSSAASVRLHQLACSFSMSPGVDILATTEGIRGHIQKIGEARVMRVPLKTESRSERLAKYQRALQRQLGHGYDLVHCVDLESARIAASMKKEKGFALVCEIIDAAGNAGESQDAGSQRSDPESSLGAEVVGALKAADRILAPSRATAGVLTRIRDARRVRLFPPVVDTGVFRKKEARTDESGPARVLWYGHRRQQEALDAEMAMLGQLLGRFPENRMELKISGAEGPAHELLKGALDTWGLTDRVVVETPAGPAASARILGRADIVVVATDELGGRHGYGFPHRLVEALAVGRPVVLISDGALLRGHLEPEKHLLTVIPQDRRGLIESVGRLIKDPGLRARLAQAGQEQILAGHRLLAFQQQYQEVMEELIRVRLPVKTFQVTTEEGDPVDSGLGPDGDGGVGENDLTQSGGAPAIIDAQPRVPTRPQPPAAQPLSEPTEKNQAAPHGRPLGQKPPTLLPNPEESLPNLISEGAPMLRTDLAETAGSETSSEHDPWAGDTILDERPPFASQNQASAESRAIHTNPFLLADSGLEDEGDESSEDRPKDKD
jgi:glycosyltransferase involved in cell wall biosynthesis